MISFGKNLHSRIPLKRYFSTRKSMPLIQNMVKNGERTCLVNKSGMWFSYDQIIERARYLAGEITNVTGKAHLDGNRVAYLCEPGDDYVVSKLATWESGGCAVPLCTSHPESELQYILDDSEPLVLISDEKHDGMAQTLKNKNPHIKHISIIQNHSKQLVSNTKFDPEDRAMLIYTSGTTGKPKGVVSRHAALNFQITDQISSWGWTPDDRILNCLPLHHVHGVVNLTLVPLYIGGCVEFMSPNASQIWQRFRMGALAGGALTLFMAVPTLYSKLIREYESMDLELQNSSTEAAGHLRLMVSGSAALPATVMERWKQITGHTLLERYGMTEFCMGLTNPLEPVSGRIPGYVGNPMPSIDVKLIDEDTDQIIEPSTGHSGALYVRGPVVFKEYWKKPEATAAEFDKDGWFKTGDVACYDPEKHSYRILGRASADIIKSGGYKLSALEIERELLQNEDIDEIVVLGVPDDYYGERVGAVIKWKGKLPFNEDTFKTWASTYLAKYKIPSVYRIVDNIPKNAMGKVSKKQLAKQIF